MEFGVRLKNYGSWEETSEAARTAEKTGFNSIWLNDHLLPPAGPLDVPFREAWTSLSALGTLTNKVKIGTLVVCNSFRNPALMAKMASTLDSITNGRVILGIGAGWHKPEYDAYGFEFPSVKERMERLEESVRIIRKMFQAGKASFEGDHYRTRDAPSIRVSGHKVPVWVGGGGPRLVRLAARLSDGWNAYRMKREDLKDRLRIFEAEMKHSGRQSRDVTISMVTDGMVASSQQTVERLVGSAAMERGIQREQFRIPENVVMGSAEEAVRTVRELEALGVQHLILNFPPLDLPEQLEYFGEEVIPHFHK